MGTKSKKSSKSKANFKDDKIPKNKQDTPEVIAAAASPDSVFESANVDDADGNIVVAVETMTAADLPVKQKKGHRQRKREFYNVIRTQMEFYFGDANLSKDRFLKQMLDKDPFVPLETFLSFNKMKALTTKVKDIAKSLSKSDLLELDDSQQKVKRKTALPENRNVDEKTLYVEALPSTADHDWVRQIFERFGKVSYISLPKYAKSRKIKEFGFVEFEKEESVIKTVKAFKDFNGVLNTEEKDPAELVSVKSYIKEQAGEEAGESVIVPTNEDGRKRPNQDLGDSEDEPNPKKLKKDTVEEESSKNEETCTQSESEVNIDDGAKKEDKANVCKEKQRKKRKKKSKLKQQTELNTDISYYELKVLPKRDWKRLRNKYLNLQREKISELKRKVWKKESKHHYNKDFAREEKCSQTPEKDHQHNKKAKSSKHKLQKMNMNFYGAAAEDETQPKTPNTEKAQQNPATERAPLFHYEPGLIVEVALLEPCVNLKEFKADMRQYAAVKYVDVKEGSMQAHLRLENPEKSKEFVHQVSCAEYQCKILSDEAESAYWQKIERDREQKLNRQVKVPQKRGREKIKKLISKHIRFGDDDE